MVFTRSEDAHRKAHAMATIPDHDSYIAAAPEAFRPALSHLRDLLREALQEMMAYDMPGFRLGDTDRNHLSATQARSR